MSSDLNTQALLRQQAIRAQLYPSDRIWHEWDWQDPDVAAMTQIQDIVQRYPDRPAILDEAGAMTYRELDAASNRVANALLNARGPVPEAIGLVVGINREALVAALGILKAAKAFVCLPLGFPVSKQKLILEDSGIELLVSTHLHRSLAHTLAEDKREILFLETLPDDAGSPGLNISADSTAIINYTSGSTGTPKGVVQSHLNVKAQSGRYFAQYRVGPQDCCAFGESLAWAGSYWKFFGAFCSGAALLPIDMNQLGPAKAIELLERYRPSLMFSRATIKELLAAGIPFELPETRIVSVGGDSIYAQDVETIRRFFPNAMISNGLGTTEAGRSTQYLIAPDDPIDFKVVPLGYPVKGAQIHLLDENLQPVSPGQVGEIAIQDAYLSRGYQNRPGLTAQKFRVLDRFGDLPIYLTGDLGRLDEFGRLRHLGRQDFQVKIRGYQVHTNEIEAILLTLPGVNAVTVVARNVSSGAKILIGYLEVAAAEFEGVGAAHKFLRDRQPGHMVPKHFVVIDKLPRTASGKIDPQALPIPERSRALVEADFCEPRTELENLLSQIWADILGVELIGIHDDFIQLGGDSLLSGQIINRVRDRFQMKLTYAEMFETQTIAEMSALIKSRQQ
jgi:amino acid adenylation domain-containing protein